MPRGRNDRSRSATGRQANEDTGTTGKRQTRGSIQSPMPKSPAKSKSPGSSPIAKADLKSPAGRGTSSGRGGGSRATSTSPVGRASRQTAVKADGAGDGPKATPTSRGKAPRGRSASRAAAKVESPKVESPPEVGSLAGGRSTSRSRGGAGISGQSAVKKARGGKSPAGSVASASPKPSSPAGRKKAASPKGAVSSADGGGRGRSGRAANASDESTSADDTKQATTSSATRAGRSTKRGTTDPRASEGGRGSHSRSAAPTDSPVADIQSQQVGATVRRGRAKKRAAGENESEDTGYVAGDEADPAMQREDKKAKTSGEGIDDKVEKIENIDDKAGAMEVYEAGADSIDVLQDYVVINKEEVPAADSSEVLASLPVDNDKEASEELTDFVVVSRSEVPSADSVEVLSSLPRDHSHAVESNKSPISTGSPSKSVEATTNISSETSKESQTVQNASSVVLGVGSTSSGGTEPVGEGHSVNAAGPVSVTAEPVTTGSVDETISANQDQNLDSSTNNFTDGSITNGKQLDSFQQQPLFIDSEDSCQSAQDVARAVTSESHQSSQCTTEGGSVSVVAPDISSSAARSDETYEAESSRPVGTAGAAGGSATVGGATSAQNGQHGGTNGASEKVHDALLERTWKKSDNTVDTVSQDDNVRSAPRSIDVVSYNILAEVHAVRDYSSAEWLGEGAGEKVRMSSRHKRLMEEIKYLSGDIVCLQEVGTEYFKNTLLPAMKQIGYDGVYYSRQHGYVEGEATFYLKSRLVLESYRGVALGKTILSEVDASSLESDIKSAIKSSVDTMAVALLTRLKVISGSAHNYINVANIHNSWDKLQRLDKQCLQVACAMRELLKCGGPAAPCEGYVICGDFNSTPDSAVCQLMENGHLSEKSLTVLQSIQSIPQSDGQMASVINYWSDGFQYSPVYGMKSAYRTVCGSDPLSTRYSDIASVQAVDYIWFSSQSLSVSGVLEAVDADLLTRGAPNEVLPSDHLSLKSSFVFIS